MVEDWIPAGEAIIKDRVIGLENHHQVKPAFWEKVAAVMVHYRTSLAHPFFKLIKKLQRQNRSESRSIRHPASDKPFSTRMPIAHLLL